MFPDPGELDSNRVYQASLVNKSGNRPRSTGKWEANGMGGARHVTSEDSHKARGHLAE